MLTDIPREFPQPFMEIVSIAKEIKHQQFYSTFFPIYHSLINPPNFEAIISNLLTCTFVTK